MRYSDPVTKPITPCSTCERVVCLTLGGRMVRHKRPEDLGMDGTDYCPGSGTPVIEPEFSPATAAIMGGMDEPDTDKLVQDWHNAELSRWWLNLSEAELPPLIAKVEEYSAYDLEMVGRMMADTIGLGDFSKAYYEEIGIWFYLLGKVSRAMGAIREGRLPSRDTALDTRIYATMILRIKESGGWPG